MPMSREDRIYLAYKANEKALNREGLDRVHARALLYVSERFALSPLIIQKIVAERQPTD
jgi:3-hydroxy-3-methylglutaryl CoA synthase